MDGRKLVIKQLETERDGIRAAMAKEAADVVKNNIVGYGGNEPYLRRRPDGEISNLLYADAILALAPLQAGYVVVPVERSIVKMTNPGDLVHIAFDMGGDSETKFWTSENGEYRQITEAQYLAMTSTKEQ